MSASEALSCDTPVWEAIRVRVRVGSTVLGHTCVGGAHGVEDGGRAAGEPYLWDIPFLGSGAVVAALLDVAEGEDDLKVATMRVRDLGLFQSDSETLREFKMG